MDLEGFVKQYAHGIVNTALLWALMQYLLFIPSILSTLTSSSGFLIVFWFFSVPIFLLTVMSSVIGLINRVVSKWLWSFDPRMSKIEVWFYGFILLNSLGIVSWISFTFIAPFLPLTYAPYAILPLVNGFISKKVAEDHSTWLFLRSKISREQEL